MRYKLRSRENGAPCSFCGKTYREVRALVTGQAGVICDGCIAEVPFVSIDATTLTAAGYAGANVESILLKLVAAAEDDA